LQTDSIRSSSMYYPHVHKFDIYVTISCIHLDVRSIVNGRTIIAYTGCTRYALCACDANDAFSDTHSKLSMLRYRRRAIRLIDLQDWRTRPAPSHMTPTLCPHMAHL
jgi:hypothetical protein